MPHSLLKEILRNRRTKQETLWYIIEQDLWEDLSLLIFDDDYDVAWRAIWMLNEAPQNKLDSLKLDIDKIIKRSMVRGSSQQREVLKFLSRTSLPEKSLGLYFDWTQSLWIDIQNIPSVRIAALRAITRVVGIHPELKSEIQPFLTPEYFDPLSPGIKKQVLQLLNALELI